MIVNGNKIYAGEGMILTDGIHYGTEVKLADGVNADVWREITEEEYKNKMASEGIEE